MYFGQKGNKTIAKDVSTKGLINYQSRGEQKEGEVKKFHSPDETGGWKG